MSKGKLTRNELSWLLTQEAQNAAERLRVGVQFLRTQAPPPPNAPAEDDPGQGVETSLDALDDVMKMLSNLNQRTVPATGPTSAGGRRGRIDVATVVGDVAPDARVAFEPGGGTEIYGDEADIRRMIQVLVGHGGGEGSTVTVKREGDEVRVSVTLGPDSSPTADTERAWLARVALRYGGKHELEGGSEVLVFPADGASDRNESAALRKELDEARKQGEVYARELAAIFDRGEEVTSVSTVPPAPGMAAADRLSALTKICAGVSSELKNALGPARTELSAKDLEIETIRRRVNHVADVVATLETIGSLRPDELDTEIDLAQVAQTIAKGLAGLADREGVKVVVRADAPAYVRQGAKALGVLVRALFEHAIEASPRSASVEISVMPADAASGPRLVVDDAGSSLPASGRRAFLALETQAGTYGRPSGLPIFLAAELAACQGAMLELSDATGPATGGLRVSVTFAKS